jgi:hypothetical protein
MSSLTETNPGNARQATRSRQLRRGLVALGIAVAIPATVATSSASAFNMMYEAKPCLYLDSSFPDGTKMTYNGSRYVCSNGSFQRDYST